MDADTFKDGAMEIFSFAQHGTCDDKKMEALIASIEHVRAECRHPSPYLKAAFSALYPALTQNEDSLGRELDDELALINRICNGEKLNQSDIGRVMNFCQEIWYQLRLFQNGSTPHK
ncbi:hypothetical protein K8R03_02530 [Candidatus Kaiserbacteria bacterium]|nr:hypothetical protein [Candidatus Kaiserbacteria bacterium]